MIFLNFSSASILFPLQHNMAGCRFSVKAVFLQFCKIANGLCTCLFLFCICFSGYRSFFFVSPPGGPGCFIRRRMVRRTVGVHGRFFVGELCFCWLLIWFFSWCRLFQRIWAGAKRGLVSFSSPLLFCVSTKTERPCLEVLSDRKTRVSDMWQGHNARLGQPK